MPEPDPRLTGAPDSDLRLTGMAGSEPGLTGARKSGPDLAGMGGSEPRLIRGYLTALAARLPPSIVEELADGLTETYRYYLSCGLDPEAAAVSAVAEFGPPETIAAGFVQVNPARRAARRLLVIGPMVGVCWVAALLTSWPGQAGGAGGAWPGWAAPGSAWVVTGLVLAGLIALLAVAALGGRYRLSALTGVAGCFGFAALDAVLIIGAVFLLAPVGWVTAVAMAASLARIAVTARALRPALAR
jgi:hypothetical protein